MFELTHIASHNSSYSCSQPVDKYSYTDIRLPATCGLLMGPVAALAVSSASSATTTWNSGGRPGVLLWPPPICLRMADELARLQFAHGLAQFGLRVHHDRPIPGHRLFERLAGDE
jgi:hypothetical protein